ncbi:hypothetical protein EKO04_011232 [Ascochyta lentis]|uniref:Uncharacterized protein n=1 Tax=Ascochyta lentis TaxID=205686 RepID=A0A8H7MCR3_9PLEO|nr:hypothetical protein EKO04_011232 [Ascochyta lentis]
MSNSASFWAAKSDGVKSPTAPASVDTQPIALGAPPKKASGMVVKGAKNDNKKSDWADSDDDDKFVASFKSTPCVQELEKTVAAKDARITDLSTELQEKEGRITELEDVVAKQQRILDDMESSVRATATQVEELKEDNHKQLLHVQELVAEVDEKNRRIAVLEADVDDHRDTLAELDIEDASTQASSHEAAVDEGGDDTKEGGTEMEAQSPKTAESTTKLGAMDDNKDTPGHAAHPSEPKITIPEASGPAVNLSEFPVFSTSATVKNTTPPPPAPKLKMGIDVSKFGKKTSTKKHILKAKMAFDAGKKLYKDGPAPIIDCASDIRTKSHEDRALFTNGLKVQVKMGDIALSTVPKYVLMQCSLKAFKHFTDSPDANTFILPADSMDADAAAAHLGWMKEMTFQRRVYSITLNTDEKFDDKNLQTCRAARVLGLNNMYVGHFTKIFCDRIRSNAASYEFLSKVAALVCPENDPIYDCLANNLANLRVRNTAKKPAELEALLDKYPGLKARVEKIGERMHMKQRSAQGAKGMKVVHVGKKMDM